MVSNVHRKDVGTASSLALTALRVKARGWLARAQALPATVSSAATKASNAEMKVFRVAMKASNVVTKGFSVARMDFSVATKVVRDRARASDTRPKASSARARGQCVRPSPRVVHPVQALSVGVRCKFAAMENPPALAHPSSRVRAERLLAVQINGVTAPSMAKVAPVT